MLYIEVVNMLEGLADEEVDQYLFGNPRIVPLFEIDVTEVVIPYIIGKEEYIVEPVWEFPRSSEMSKKHWRRN